MPLSDAMVRTAKAKDKPYKLTDEKGLHLHVAPTGHRSWRLRREVNGKENLRTLGTYPAMTLKQARERREELLGNGGVNSRPFAEVAREWHARQVGRWTARHAEDVIESLTRDVFPAIGTEMVDEIRPAAILKALRAVEGRGAHETAHRLRQRVEAVFAYAIGEGLLADNPAIQVHNALTPVPSGKRQPAITDLAEAREMLKAAEATPAHPGTRLALRLIALTAVRPGEIRGAMRQEFEGLDTDAPMWRIPPERMKMKVEHLVPMVPAAVETVLAAMSLIGHGDLLFPSERHPKKPLSENAIGYLLHRAGYHSRHVPHGWRATFSSIMNERFPADRALIDLMLAHAPKDRIESAYNRATHMERRRELAQAWADLLLEGFAPAESLLILRRR